MNKNQTRIKWLPVFPAWYELNEEWSCVSSYWWEQEDEIQETLNRLGIEYHIKNDSSIEDRGFNLWVKNEDRCRVTKIGLIMEGKSEKEAEEFVNRYKEEFTNK